MLEAGNAAVLTLFGTAQHGPKRVQIEYAAQRSCKIANNTREPKTATQQRGECCRRYCQSQPAVHPRRRTACASRIGVEREEGYSEKGQHRRVVHETGEHDPRFEHQRSIVNEY